MLKIQPAFDIVCIRANNSEEFQTLIGLHSILIGHEDLDL